jgi:hypothetical protein
MREESNGKSEEPDRPHEQSDTRTGSRTPAQALQERLPESPIAPADVRQRNCTDSPTGVRYLWSRRFKHPMSRKRLTAVANTSKGSATDR